MAKGAAIFGDHRVVALRQSADERIGSRSLRRRNDLLARRIGLAVRDVVVHRALEEPRLLQHHAEGTPEAIARDARGICAIHADFASIHIVEAKQQVDEGRLAAARWPHQGVALPRLSVHADIPQQRTGGNVGEIHVRELDLAPSIHQLYGAGSIGLFFRRIHEREEAPRRGESRLNLRDHAGDLVERLRVLIGIREEGLNAAHRERGGPTSDNAHAPHDRYDGVDHVVHGARPRIGQRAQELRALAGNIELLVEGVEPLEHLVAMGEHVHELLAPHELLDVPAELPLDALLVDEARMGEPCDRGGHKHRERRHEHHDHGHGNRDRQHERERAHDGHDTGEELSEPLEQAVANLIGVVDHATHEVAVRMAVDERDGHAAELVVRLGAQIAHGLVGEAIHAVPLHPLEGSRTHNDHDELQEEGCERAEAHPARRDDAVDPAPHKNGHIELEHD